MASFNKVILIETLPVIRRCVTPNGHTICKLGLAVSRAQHPRRERCEETTFVDIDAFGKQAEVISKYMRKGRLMMVEGRLKLDRVRAMTGRSAASSAWCWRISSFSADAMTLPAAAAAVMNKAPAPAQLQTRHRHPVTLSPRTRSTKTFPSSPTQ